MFLTMKKKAYQIQVRKRIPNSLKANDMSDSVNVKTHNTTGSHNLLEVLEVT